MELSTYQDDGSRHHIYDEPKHAAVKVASCDAASFSAGNQPTDVNQVTSHLCVNVQQSPDSAGPTRVVGSGCEDDEKVNNRPCQQYVVVLAVLVIVALILGGASLALVIREIEELKVHVREMETAQGQADNLGYTFKQHKYDDSYQAVQQIDNLTIANEEHVQALQEVALSINGLGKGISMLTNKFDHQAIENTNISIKLQVDLNRLQNMLNKNIEKIQSLNDSLQSYRASMSNQIQEAYNVMQLTSENQNLEMRMTENERVLNRTIENQNANFAQIMNDRNQTMNQMTESPCSDLNQTITHQIDGMMSQLDQLNTAYNQLNVTTNLVQRNLTFTRRAVYNLGGYHGELGLNKTLHYLIYGPVVCQCSAAAPCRSGSISSIGCVSGFIRSYSYPANYANGISQSWTLLNPGASVLKLTLFDFNLEGAASSGQPTSYCPYDWLSVLSNKYCGTVPANTTVDINVAGVQSISMNFRSDGSSVGRGFNLQFTFYHDYGLL